MGNDRHSQAGAKKSLPPAILFKKSGRQDVAGSIYSIKNNNLNYYRIMDVCHQARHGLRRRLQD